MKELAAVLAAVIVLLASCGRPSVDLSGVPELPSISPDQLHALIRDGGRPAVVNVWASWCIPCRSEAPLLRAAHEEEGDRILFIGVDVQDTQSNARAFIAEFGLTNFDHYFDPGRSVPNTLGRTGVPITFFFDSAGDLVSAHSGVIDERTLAASISDLVERD